MTTSPATPPPDRELTALTAIELRDGYVARRFSPVDVVDAVAERIQRVDPAVDAFTTLLLDDARTVALAAERTYAAGEAASPLLGIPVGVKDLFDTAGHRTTYGSAMFARHVPLHDATIVRRLKEAGAILVGKTATHEFSWGITTNNPHFGPTRNPWHVDRIPGGSSGGSAVALATHQVPLAVGSDTGGSIRIPAAYCGVVGLKPTFGRVSKAGAFPLATSLDHVGPLARTAADAALLLGVLAGSDPDDPYTDGPELGDAIEPRETLDGLRVGVCPDLHLVPLAADIQTTYEETVETCRRLGAEIVECRFPEADLAHESFGIIQRAEAFRSHERAGLFPRRLEYGSDVRARLERAAEVTLADYLGAVADRQQIRARFVALLREVDVLVVPVSACSPPRIGDEHVLHRDQQMLFRDAVMPYTVPESLAGVPAVAVRAGFDRDGMPIGMQLVAGHWREPLLLGAAACLLAGTADVQASWPEPTIAPASVTGVA